MFSQFIETLFPAAGRPVGASARQATHQIAGSANTSTRAQAVGHEGTIEGLHLRSKRKAPTIRVTERRPSGKRLLGHGAQDDQRTTCVAARYRINKVIWGETILGRKQRPDFGHFLLDG